jgi:hypothetical protein
MHQLGEECRMVNPAVKKQILSDLERLSPELQTRAAQLVRDLVATRPQGVPGRDLLRFAGLFDAETTRQMKEAIEEGCERVDLDEW